MFLVVRHIPVETFLLINLFDATHISNVTFLTDRQIFVN